MPVAIAQLNANPKHIVINLIKAQTNDNNVCNAIQSLCVTSCGEVWRSMNRKDLCPECMEAIKAFLSNDAYIVRKVEKGEKLCH